MLLPSVLLCSISKYNVKTLLNLIMVNKEMIHLAKQNRFWYEVYQYHNIPIDNNDNKLDTN